LGYLLKRVPNCKLQINLRCKLLVFLACFNGSFLAMPITSPRRSSSNFCKVQCFYPKDIHSLWPTSILGIHSRQHLNKCFHSKDIHSLATLQGVHSRQQQNKCLDSKDNHSLWPTSILQDVQGSRRTSVLIPRTIILYDPLQYFKVSILCSIWTKYSSQGQPFSLAHFNTSRCPLRAAYCVMLTFE